jgi:glycosyltransferase involved in cell wall biosynthesis
MLTSGETGGIESLCRDIARFGRLEHGFCFVTGGGAVYEQMKREGRTVYCLADEGRKLSLHKLKMLKKILAEYDAVVVHHEDPFLKMYYIALKKKFKGCGVTIVHSCYDDSMSAYRNRVKRFIYERITQKCFDVSDKVWYVSNAGRESCHRLYSVAQDKEKVIYNGVSPEFLEKADENRLKLNVDGTYRITYIGRLVKVKGVDLLVQAVAEIAKEKIVTLDVVGDGEERANLEELAQRLGIAENVHFYGRQADVGKFLNKSDIFVYPSVWQEVFGISIVEAMAHGLPCVANNVGGIPEIVEDGKSGFLTKEPTANGLAEAVRRVIGLYENGGIEEVSRNAKARAQKFSVQRTCDLMEGELTGSESADYQ